MIDNVTNSIIDSDSLLADKSKQIEDIKLSSNSVDKKEKLAKDFESLLIGKLLDEVQKSVGNFSFNDDKTSKQVNGMFWHFLGQDISENGGFGLWKDIYKSFESIEQASVTNQKLDENI